MQNNFVKLGQMIFLHSCSIWLILLFALNIVQSNNVAAMECPETLMKLNTRCHHSQVPVPFAFTCGDIPVNYCHDVENLLEPNISTKVYLDGHRIFDRRLKDDCWNVTTTYIKSGHWQIELDRIENVYVVLIRSLGLNRNESNGFQVTVSRRLSTNRSESIRCHDSEYFDGYHTFLCYQSGDKALTSNYRPGYDAKFVDIFGDIYVDDSCDFSNIVKVYSYPIRVCGIPEAHQNQSIMPKAHYYLVGQEVIYNCSDDAHILIGDPIRICQHNGLWSGKTPICIQVNNVQPQTRFVRFMENAEFYWPAKSLAKATRIDENEMITYGFETEYCLKYILLEYHSELSERTDILIYTTSMDGYRHVWTANDTFGDYANKQYFLPGNDQSFICCLNVTIQRHKDKPSQGILKRSEFVYHIEAVGYHRRNGDCLKPHLFPNVKFSIHQNHTVENGVTVKLECNKGFRQRNDDPPEIQCDNGSWKGIVPICDIENCPQPNSRRHSSWKYLENQHLKYHRAEYECHSGFELKGHNTSTCNDGKWTTPPPKCKVTFCPNVAIPPNMFCMLNRRNEFYDVTGNGTSFHHGISLVCYCQPGFRVTGNRTIHCSNQQWTSELPKCQEILCENPPFSIRSGGNQSLVEQRYWKTGSHNFSCPEKMTIKGLHGRTSVELTCWENGEWEDTELFECIEQGNNTLGCAEIAGIVVGVVLAVVLTLVAYVIIKRFRKKVKETRKVNESKRNLTIAEDGNNASYISFSCEMDDNVALVGEVSKLIYPTYDPQCTESNESEIDVIT